LTAGRPGGMIVPMQQTTLIYVKLALAACMMICITVLSALGKIDGASAVSAMSTATGALLVALGISGGASAMAAAQAAPTTAAVAAAKADLVKALEGVKS
jgi:hypothetical protein